MKVSTLIFHFIKKWLKYVKVFCIDSNMEFLVFGWKKCILEIISQIFTKTEAPETHIISRDV